MASNPHPKRQRTLVWFRGKDLRVSDHAPLASAVASGDDYVPELARLPAKFIHRPAAAPKNVRESAGVTLGVTYPEPIVDHAMARDRFLKIAESHLKRRGAGSERGG